MLELKVNQQSVYSIDVKNDALHLNDKKINWDIIKITDNTFNIIKDNKSYNIEVVQKDGKTYEMLINGNEYTIDVKNDLDLLLTKMGISSSKNNIANDLKAPMPGLVIDVKVKVGQKIKKGEAILVLEAMKMENVLKSPTDATIKFIGIQKGNNVEKNAILVEFE